MMTKTHNTAQTSIWSYHSLDDLGTRQREVLAVIRHKGFASNREIAVELGLEIGSVTGRTNELVSKGFVTEAYKASDKRTGKMVIFWKSLV